MRSDFVPQAELILGTIRQAELVFEEAPMRVFTLASMDYFRTISAFPVSDLDEIHH